MSGLGWAVAVVVALLWLSEMAEHRRTRRRLKFYQAHADDWRDISNRWATQANLWKSAAIDAAITPTREASSPPVQETAP